MVYFCSVLRILFDVHIHYSICLLPYYVNQIHGANMYINI